MGHYLAGRIQCFTLLSLEQTRETHKLYWTCSSFLLLKYGGVFFFFESHSGVLHLAQQFWPKGFVYNNGASFPIYLAK